MDREKDTSLSASEQRKGEKIDLYFFAPFPPSQSVTIERANPKSESGLSPFVAPPDSGQWT